jgi:hypothetical protein
VNFRGCHALAYNNPTGRASVVDGGGGCLTSQGKATLYFLQRSRQLVADLPVSGFRLPVNA